MSGPSIDDVLGEKKLEGELEKKLKDFYVVSSSAGEKLIGKCPRPEELSDGEDFVTLEEVRQVVSMNVQLPGRGMVRKTMIGTLDLAMGPIKSMEVKVSTYYKAADQNLTSMQAIWEELEDADQRDTIQRAQASGLSVARGEVATAQAEVSARRPFPPR